MSEKQGQRPGRQGTRGPGDLAGIPVHGSVRIFQWRESSVHVHGDAVYMHESSVHLHKSKMHLHKSFVHMNKSPVHPFESFIQRGKAGKCLERNRMAQFYK